MSQPKRISLFYFDGTKIIILNNPHPFLSLFSARAYALTEGGGGKDVPHFAILVTLAFHEKDDSQVVVF
jgi:hypothetical protein